MAKQVDPKQFGLSPRACIEKETNNHFILVIDRKSRLIMADGHRIIVSADKIRSIHSGCKVSLRTTAPVCSKTKAFLTENKIDIL